MNFILKINAIALCSVVMVGCSNFQQKNTKDWVGYTETGKASFYADKHQSRKTASGEIYKHNLSTAAHKTLPLGTKVKVMNVENRKSVVVKINDRGPFVKGRIIDLSKSAFSTIGSTSSGLINVHIEVVK